VDFGISINLCIRKTYYEFSYKEVFESQNLMTNCLGNQELKLYRIFLKKIINNDHKSDKEFQR
jgi:hypothetical protein